MWAGGKSWACTAPRKLRAVRTLKLGRSCPLPCPSFSSVSSNSLQELQSKRSCSQTAPWNQYGCFEWLDKKKTACQLQSSLMALQPLEDELCLITSVTSWKVFLGFLVQLLGSISKHQCHWGNTTKATSPASLAKDPVPHSSSAWQRGLELRCYWTPQSFAAFFPIAAVSLRTSQIKTTLALISLKTLPLLFSFVMNMVLRQR